MPMKKSKREWMRVLWNKWRVLMDSWLLYKVFPLAEIREFYKQYNSGKK